MSQDIINNRFLEESVFAIADGYCVINLTRIENEIARLDSMVLNA